MLKATYAQNESFQRETLHQRLRESKLLLKCISLLEFEWTEQDLYGTSIILKTYKLRTKLYTIFKILYNRKLRQHTTMFYILWIGCTLCISQLWIKLVRHWVFFWTLVRPSPPPPQAKTAEIIPPPKMLNGRFWKSCCQ